MNKLGLWLLKRCLSDEIRDAVLGDLDEMVAEMTHEADGAPPKASLTRQVLEALPFLLIEKLSRRLSLARSRGKGVALGPEHRPGLSFLALASLSIGFCCCLALLAITRDFRTDKQISPAIQNRNIGFSGTAGLPKLIPAGLLPRTARSSSETDVDRWGIRRARRLMTIEVFNIIAAGLVFVASIKAADPIRGRQSGFPRRMIRLAWFLAMLILAYQVLTRLLVPAFASLSEVQKVLYWLVSIWLFVGAASTIVPVIIITGSTQAHGRPRRGNMIFLAFVTVFIFGTLLIMHHIDFLKQKSPLGERLQAQTSSRTGPDDSVGQR